MRFLVCYRRLAWAASLLLPLTQACSYTAPAYLRNLSDQPVAVRLEGYGNWYQSIPQYLRYAPALLTPRQLRPERLTDSLRPATDSATVSFVLPPHATICVGAFHNGTKPFRTLVVERANQPVRLLDLAAAARQLKPHQVFGGSLYVCLDLH
jgi:hypothetical protein